MDGGIEGGREGGGGERVLTESLMERREKDMTFLALALRFNALTIQYVTYCTTVQKFQKTDFNHPPRPIW